LLAAADLQHDTEALAWAEIELKYAGYLGRERAAAERLSQMEDFTLPEGLPFHELETLSFEAREKLGVARPKSLGQAGRIPGVSPSDLQCLVLEVLKRRA
jgi:tRNA uridine 5-carboxymethylaminomethyl modification enzyme